MREVLVVGTSPSVSRRWDSGRGVAPNVAAGAGLGVRLGVDVGAEVGGQGGRPIGGAGGIEVDGEVERLEVADVLQANSTANSVYRSFSAVLPTEIAPRQHTPV